MPRTEKSYRQTAYEIALVDLLRQLGVSLPPGKPFSMRVSPFPKDGIFSVTIREYDEPDEATAGHLAALRNGVPCACSYSPGDSGCLPGPVLADEQLSDDSGDGRAA